MMLVGVLILRKIELESESWRIAFIYWLTDFFNARLVELFTSLTTYTKGLLSVFLRQLFGYLMRLHKILLRRFNSQQILFIFISVPH